MAMMVMMMMMAVMMMALMMMAVIITYLQIATEWTEPVLLGYLHCLTELQENLQEREIILKMVNETLLSLTDDAGERPFLIKEPKYHRKDPDTVSITGTLTL